MPIICQKVFAAKINKKIMLVESIIERLTSINTINFWTAGLLCYWQNFIN